MKKNIRTFLFDIEIETSIVPWAHGLGYMYVATPWLGYATGKRKIVAVDANPREKAKNNERMEIYGHLNNLTKFGFCVFVNVVSDPVG
ncbi:MAG: hypothetical protein IK005_10575 [Paludibacteraceae bacterium]|nr:hypothetical protein [Paludibacteraceae bacterium]